MLIPKEGVLIAPPTYLLGIEVARGKDCFVLSQSKYVLDLLAETCILDCKPVDTLI